MDHARAVLKKLVDLSRSAQTSDLSATHIAIEAELIQNSSVTPEELATAIAKYRATDDAPPMPAM